MKRKIILAAMALIFSAIGFRAWHERPSSVNHVHTVASQPLTASTDREEQFRQALAAEKGLGTSKDIKKAEQLYLQAAAQNLLPAQYALGRLYESGSLGEKNMNAAFHWYSLAAERGHMVAQYHLGLMYFRGEGAAKDPVKAWLWFSMANQKPTKQSAEASITVWRGMSVEEQKTALAAWPDWKADYSTPAENSWQ